MALAAACATPAAAPDTRPADPAAAKNNAGVDADATPTPRASRSQAGWLRAVTRHLKRNDPAAAARVLQRAHWYVADRARAALLLAGCRLRLGQHEQAMKVLRDYIAKTPHQKNPRDATALHLLRHHATGGALEPRDGEEAVYFALYARHALEEPESALPLIERARQDAPSPEILLLEAA